MTVGVYDKYYCMSKGYLAMKQEVDQGQVTHLFYEPALIIFEKIVGIFQCIYYVEIERISNGIIPEGTLI